MTMHWMVTINSRERLALWHLLFDPISLRPSIDLYCENRCKQTSSVNGSDQSREHVSASHDRFVAAIQAPENFHGHVERRSKILNGGRRESRGVEGVSLDKEDTQYGEGGVKSYFSSVMTLDRGIII
jgi:hypothetical protein